MRKSGLIFIILLSFIISFSFSTQAAFNLYIGEHLTELHTPLKRVNGNILVPLSVIADYLAVKIEMVDETRFTMEFPTKTITMQIDEVNALVNGVEQVLEVPPMVSNNEIMVPLRFIADALNFRIVFDNQQMALVLVLNKDMAEYVASKLADPDWESRPKSPTVFTSSTDLDEFERAELREIVFLDGPRSRVFIDVQGYTAYESVLLTEPDRLFIDLIGIDGDPLPVLELNDPIIQRIRSSRFNENTIRIVLDLNEATHYKIHRWPNGGLEIEFNYQIGDFQFYRDANGIAKLAFSGTAQPPFQSTSFHSPTRLSLDFQDTTLIGGYKEFSVDDSRVKQIRVSQYTPSVTRVVLDLTAPLTPVSSRKVNDQFEVIFFDGTAEDYQRYTLSQPEVDPYIAISSDAEEADMDLDDSEKPLKGRVVVIDPGHGGSDPGAIGVAGTFEKDIVLDIGLKLGELLEAAGARVAYTRIDDRYVSIFDRPVVAEIVNADIFISIHCNSYEGELAKGIETLYSPLFLENFRLAQIIQKELVVELEMQDRGLRPRPNLHVLNSTSMPSVMVELGFLSHPEEEKLLNSSQFRARAADALFNGVVRYFMQQN